MVERFVEQFTYLGLLLSLFASGIGLPIPEEVPVAAGGVLAYKQVIRWWVALPVCLVGVLSGDLLLYAAGRRWGEQILAWAPVRWMLTPGREEALVAGYHRHGVKIVFVARHLVGLRAAAFITAGIVRVPFWKFLVVDVAGALVSVPVAFGLAFVFTEQLQQVLADVYRIERWLALYAIVALAGFLLWLAWRKSRP